MRKAAIAVILLALASIITLFDLYGDDPDDSCEPENPYLFCGHECRSNSCVSDIHTGSDDWCVLQFPGCEDGKNHKCCDSGAGL